MVEPAIKIESLSKSYGKVTALDKVSFSVEQGELFGLIGPDGAGKTTLFRILTTLLNADKGKATISGNDISKDIEKIRSSVGYMPGHFSLYQDLSIEENLQFFASIFGVTIEENIDLIAPIYTKLEPFKKRKAGKLSGGMKQKLALSCALIHRPAILFLDEPTTGVDAVSRTEFWEMLRSLKEKGITILVSTPYMDEASMCDRIALIDRGEILAVDTPKEIVRQNRKNIYAASATEMYRLLQVIRKESGVEMVYPFGGEHHLVVNETFDASEIKLKLEAEHFEKIEIKKIEATIEDVFITLMK